MINLIANIVGSKIGPPSGAPAYVFSQEYEAIQTYCQSNSIALPSEAAQQVDDKLIKDLVDTSIWEEADAIWNHTTDGNGSYALVNLKNPGSHTGTLHGTVAPSYVAKEGFHGNSAQSAYINYNWTPSAHGVKFSQNNASLHVYTLSTAAINNNLLGTTNASAAGRLFTKHRAPTTDHVQVFINANTSVQSSTGVGGAGLISGVRFASTDVRCYKDGVEVGTSSVSSNDVSDHPMLGLAFNNNGTPAGFEDVHLGLVIVGSSNVTPSTLNTIWNNHLARIAALT